MRFDPNPEVSARLRTARAHMRSALALLDLEEGTGFTAAHLQHAICLLEEGLDLEGTAAEPELSPGS